MENLNLTLVSSPKLVLGFSPKNQRDIILNRRQQQLSSFVFRERRSNCPIRPKFFVASALSNRSSTDAPKISTIVLEKCGAERFASISSSNSEKTSSVGVNPQLSVPTSSSSYVGSPLFWIGVGVGLSAFFSWAATNLKKYAMQQAFKTMMGQMDSQNSQFNSGAAFSPGSPFPFPTPSASGPVTSPFQFPTPSASGPVASPSPAPSKPDVTVDVPATKVEATPANYAKVETEEKKEPKKYAFVDISPEETSQDNPFESFKDVTDTSSSKNAQFVEGVNQNGAAAAQQDTGASGGSQYTRNAGPGLSVEALEKMMEDPTVQKMVYPYLPEEMRNPTTFKWMLQNPQYRQQLEEMLNNMGGSSEWDNRMMDSLKNFDLSSPEVKQQFDQVGLTPEEVISKIMANPEVAMAFQNPRVQAAIMDCSQNPLSIGKYQNDKEVMDVFNKISELFPGVAGPP